MTRPSVPSVAAPLLVALALLASIPAQAQQTPLGRRPLSVPSEANPSASDLGAPSRPADTAPPRRGPPPPPARTARTRQAPGRAPMPGVAAPPPGEAPHARVAEALTRDLDAAMALDAGGRGIAAQREATRARDALVRSPIPGAPSVGSLARSSTRGTGIAREFEMEIAAPIWLPGQRSALAGTVAAGVTEADRRLAQRRLEVAGRLREAYWAAGAAESERRVALERLVTTRDIAHDLSRRAELGDLSATEALLGRNESLAAELEVARAEGAAQVARAAYRTLTGGSSEALQASGSGAGGMAGVPPEPLGPPAGVDLSRHPAMQAAEAALDAADAQLRLVAATPRDNPEIGLFGRTEGGTVTEQGTSLGLRFRLPLATEARNAPRRAAAEAERTRALAELEQMRRVLEGEAAQARIRLGAASQARTLAAERRRVADRQLRDARTAFANGEIGAFDLFRVRQLQNEALAAEAQAAIELGRARSRLNQALGLPPQG